MMDLHRFFLNPFEDKVISIDELVAFTADHLARLSARNDGEAYNSMIAATAPAFEALSGHITDTATESALRKARTAATQATRAELHGALSALEALAHARLSRGSPAYLELFPGGLQAFREAPVDGLGTLLDALLANLENHKDTLGAADVEALSALAARWKTIRGEQLTTKAGAASAADQRRAASAALRRQLYQNLLTLALQANAGEETAREFFTQALLEDPSRAKDPAEPASQPVPATT